MNYILGLLVAMATTSPIALNSPTRPVEASSVSECNPVAKEAIYAKIGHYSALYGVSEGMMTYVVFNESAKTPKGDLLPCGIGDTHLTDPNGNQHVSRGIVQINDYWQKEVTEAQAFDVDFSLDFLASNLSKGRCFWWTTCRAWQRLVASP